MLEAEGQEITYNYGILSSRNLTKNFVHPRHQQILPRNFFNFALFSTNSKITLGVVAAEGVFQS